MITSLQNRRSTLFIIDITTVTLTIMVMSLAYYGYIKPIFLVAGFFLLQGVSISSLYHPCTNNAKIFQSLFGGLFISFIPIYIVLYVYQIVVQSGILPETFIEHILSIIMGTAVVLSTFNLIIKNKTLTDFSEAILLVGILSFCAFFIDIKFIQLITQSGIHVLLLKNFTIFKVILFTFIQSFIAIFMLRNIYQSLMNSFNKVNFIYIGEKEHLNENLKESIKSLPGYCSFKGVISFSDKTINKQNYQLGHITNLIPICKANYIHSVMLEDLNLLQEEQLYELYKLGIEVTTSLELIETTLEKIPLQYVSLAWINDHVKTQNRLLYHYNKRLMDIIIGFIILLVTFPITFIIWLCNLLTSPGPLFYAQKRVGQFGQHFDMHKFRSMRVDAEKHQLGFEGSKNDPRVTLAGHIIRPIRLDEVPQMINILQGSLSLVGPRPDIVQTVEKLKELIPFHSLRRIIVQGWTGWAQLNAGHTNTLEENRYKFEYDLYYLKYRSIYLDFHIFFRALYIVFFLGCFKKLYNIKYNQK